MNMYIYVHVEVYDFLLCLHRSWTKGSGLLVDQGEWFARGPRGVVCSWTKGSGLLVDQGEWFARGPRGVVCS